MQSGSDSGSEYIKFALKLAHKPYIAWESGDSMESPGWACNGPVPPMSQINGMYCVGLVNLVKRYLGQQVPGGGIPIFLMDQYLRGIII